MNRLGSTVFKATKREFMECRAYVVGEEDHLLRRSALTVLITKQPSEQAQALVDGHEIELW